MSKTFTPTHYRADLEQTNSVTVEVDVVKLCATYAVERAAFGGSDEDFVRDTLHEIAYDLLNPESGAPIVDDGIVIKYMDVDFDCHVRPVLKDKKP